MVVISPTLINELENQIDNYSDSQLEKAFEALDEKQPFLSSYVNATQEIFEDEEDFIELGNYFHLLINMAFNKVAASLEKIPVDLIQNVDESMISLMEELSNEDDPDERIMDLFESHPQSELILYMYDTIFEADTDYDDSFMEMGTQLILFIYGVVEIYSKHTA